MVLRLYVMHLMMRLLMVLLLLLMMVKMRVMVVVLWLMMTMLMLQMVLLHGMMQPSVSHRSGNGDYFGSNCRQVGRYML